MERRTRPFSSIKPSMTNHGNSRYLMAKLSVPCVYANFSHFYLGIFCLRILCLFKCPLKLKKSVYYLVITLCKCEYCLIWVLNKSLLFGSNSLKISVLLDINSGKVVVLFASNSLKTSILFDNEMKSGKICSIVSQSWLQSSWKLFKAYVPDGSVQGT